MGAGPVGAGDPIGTRPGLGAEDAVDLVGLSGRPVGCPQQNGEEAVDEGRVVVQELLVDGDGARGAVVDPEPAVGQFVELDGHFGAGPAGRLDGQRALDVDGVDVSASQCGEFGRPLTRVPVCGYVDERGVRRRESGGGERPLEAAQGHGPPEVDGDVVPRHGEPQPAQCLGAPDAGAGGDQDGLPFLDPGEADQPGAFSPRTCPQSGDVAALPEQPRQGVGVVRGTVGVRGGVLEGAYGDAVSGELGGEPLTVGGDAGCRGDRTAGEPEGPGQDGRRHGVFPRIGEADGGAGGRTTYAPERGGTWRGNPRGVGATRQREKRGRVSDRRRWTRGRGRCDGAA